MSEMIIRGSSLKEVNFRTNYPINQVQDELKHFTIWHTTPKNPFKPHKHDGLELWFILKGNAIVTLNGEEYRVEEGDLVVLKPWSEHGLRTETSARWICLG